MLHAAHGGVAGWRAEREVVEEVVGDRVLDDPCIAAAKVVCLGPVTTAAVEALGIRVDATATAPTDEAMVAALRGVLEP